MRILIVGAGMYVLGRGTNEWGTVLPALAEASRHVDIDEVMICSTSDSNATAVNHVTQQINARLGTGIRTKHERWPDVLRSDRFDCAIVSVPDDLHHHIGRTVLEADLHCLMVKPFVPTVAEARDLIGLAAQRNLHGAVEFHKRYDEANLVVRRMIQDGDLGQIAYVTVEYSQRITVPSNAFAAWAARTNIFQYLGVHYVDLLSFMTGYRPRRVAAVGTKGVLLGRGIDTYDSIHALTEWQSTTDPTHAFVAQFAVGWIDPESTTALSDQRYVVVGSKARVECDQKNRGLHVAHSGGRVVDVNPYFSQYLASGDGRVVFSGYGQRSIQQFVLDVRDLKQGRTSASALRSVRPSFESALASTGVLEAVRDSLQDNSAWRDVDAVL